MKTAFCVGNGESRLNVNLDAFDAVGPIYGCNAIYRDQASDNVIANTRDMVDEAIAAESHTRANFYTFIKWKRYYKQIPEVKYIPTMPVNKKWACGPAALYLAALQESDIIIMLGYDLYGFDGKINNVYKGSNNYSAADSKAVNYDIWVEQCSIIFEKYPNIQFVQIQNESWEPPNKWLKYDNVVYDTFGAMSILLTDLSI